MAEEKEKPNTTEDATGPSSVLEKIYTYYTGERFSAGNTGPGALTDKTDNFAKNY